MNATFPANFPGRCLCGASFAAGAQICWDRSIKRATLCPSCRAPKLVSGPAHLVAPGITASLHRHPDTGLVVAVEVRATDGGWRDVEVYRLAGGQWSLAQSGGYGVLTRPAAHATILSWIDATGEGAFATPKALAA